LRETHPEGADNGREQLSCHFQQPTLPGVPSQPSQEPKEEE